MKHEPPVPKNFIKLTGKKDVICPTCNIKGRAVLKASGICSECYEKSLEKERILTEIKAK